MDNPLDFTPVEGEAWYGDYVTLGGGFTDIKEEAEKLCLFSWENTKTELSKKGVNLGSPQMVIKEKTVGWKAKAER